MLIAGRKNKGRQQAITVMNASEVTQCVERAKRRLMMGAIGLLVGLGLSGCDYWPPALHHEIEELSNDLDDALDERQRLDTENVELRGLQESFQREVEEKRRENEELRSRLATLMSQKGRPSPVQHMSALSADSPRQIVIRGPYAPLRLATPPMKGPRVARIQRLLRRRGFPIRVDAVYGPETAAAVSGFQRYHRLLADGAVGPVTERALRRGVNAPKLVRQLWLQNPPLKGQDVMLLQRALRHAGQRITVDGRFGPETDIAVTRFQKKRGLEPDGIVGMETWSDLKTHR